MQEEKCRVQSGAYWIRTPRKRTSVTLAIMTRCGRETPLQGWAVEGQSGQTFEPGVPTVWPGGQ